MVYEDVVKIRGPYKSNKDGRLRCQLLFKDGSVKTISYPKYLIEKYLDRYLLKNETVDHIDKNPLNNEIFNLRVLNRDEHCKNDAKRNESVKVKCSFCGKEFEIEGKKIRNRNRIGGKNNRRIMSGYFCSKTCSGMYGKMIQMNQIDKIKGVEKVEIKKYSIHE